MSHVVVDNDASGVTTLTLNRPDRLNALTLETVRSLHAAFDALVHDHACRVVVVTGAGRAFSAGLDLVDGPGSVPGTEGFGMTHRRVHVQEAFAGLVRRLHELPQPVIAAVNGAAVGVGLALALAADIRVAAESARFGAASVRAGYSAGESGTSYFLPRLVGATHAFELMLTGRLVDAAEALRIGLVSAVVPGDELQAAARERADLILANTPLGVWMTKQIMWRNLEATSLAGAIDLENRTQVLCAGTEDSTEAKQSFLEKREPRFHNR